MVACRAEEPRAWPVVTKSREELILEHMPQVKLIARRIYKGLPPSVTLDDLISAGIIGLIAAIDRYEIQLDVKLRTYAEYKIRGAILDSLRVLDWAPRQHRRRARRIEKTVLALEQQQGRPPCEEEVAERLGIDIEEYHDWIAESRGLMVGSLEAPKYNGEGKLFATLASTPEEQWPSEVFEREELGRLLRDAIGHIPRIEATVVSLYFYEGLTLREIAKLVDLHESRVSQLKGQAMSRLRSTIQKVWPQGPNAARARSIAS